MTYFRPVSQALSAVYLMGALAAPISACQTRQEPPPPVDDTRTGNGTSRSQTTSPGMTTKTKVVMLAGAAALYYLYKRHQNASSNSGAESQYFLSKNGRVYYRDAEHRAHWVTPPPEGIAVSESEAANYQSFQGYNNNTTGRDLTGLGSDVEAQ